MAAFVFQSRIISAPIAAEADAAEFLYTLLSYPLAENSGIACQFFLAGQIQQNYESMVYFTIHSFPKELALIPAILPEKFRWIPVLLMHQIAP